ncbi:MAG: hypothetical protein GXO80_02370 [Chlorobi bacterium]|nr:hypothetical protein [Chlorobiota bacterium]
MKTSKIILISILGSLIIWITAVFFTATAKIKHLLKENGFEQTEKVKKVDNGKTLKLENFSIISVAGKGELTIQQSNENSFQYFSDKENKPEVKNDTLFFVSEGNDNFINAENLKTVLLSDKVNVEIIDIKTDTFNIKTSDKSKAEINNLKTNVLNIFSTGKSSAELYELKNQNIASKFVLKDKSRLYIDNSNNLNMIVEKDADAKIEINN